MPKFIVKLAEDKFVEWSTIVDAPVTYILSKEGMIEYLDAEYGRASKENNVVRVDRADKTGTSSMMGDDLESIVSGNRAGPKETEISLAEIIEQYDPKNAEANGDV